jgi:3-oxoacyl-[acyl-carrier protein] reductase
MNIDLSNKFAIVTGGSRGIGKAIVETLRSCGCKVLYTSRNSGAKQAQEYTLDLQDKQSLDDFMQVIRDLKKIDIFVNNAGIFEPQSVWDIDEKSLQATINTNLIGPALLLREVAKIMRAQGHGKIVNISSIAGLVAKRRATAYASSKAGLNGLTRAVATDLAEFGVLVNSVSPGPTATDMVEQLLSKQDIKIIEQTIPLKRLASTNEIAKVVLFLCSELNSYITGQNIVVDGGFTIN